MLRSTQSQESIRASLKPVGAIAISVTSLLVLTGCSAFLEGFREVLAEEASPSQEATASPSPSQNLGDLDGFYAQGMTWVPCWGEFECTEIAAPLDWDNPESGEIKLSMIRSKVDQPLGSLLVNPGGPGGSGVDYVINAFTFLGTPELRNEYSIVGFDPRGVGESTAVVCGDRKLKDELLYAQSPHEYGNADDLARSENLITQFAENCATGSGEILPYIDTVSAARDLDLMRHLLGDEQLNYLGFSYGTKLGATYAALYPDRVGRMVLDGAIDPRVSEEEQLIAQAAGFELAFTNYVMDCLSRSDCPLNGSVNQALAQVSQFLGQLETETLRTDLGRPLTLSGGFTGIIAALYSTANWQFLTQGLTEAFGGDGTTLLFLADFYNDRSQSGSYESNLIEANIAINCADGRFSRDTQVVAETNAALLEAAPLFGRYFQNPQVSCSGWGEPRPQAALDYSVALANPILVLGTTGDPATPYQQAVALADLMSGATLITYEGDGHTVYAGISVCVDELVDSYFLAGEVPAADAVCSS